MEFRMNADVFKNKVERAMAVSKKTKEMDFQRHIKIEANKGEDTVCISATNVGTYVIVKCVPGECEVVESGEAYLDIDTVKRLFNASGSCRYFSEDGTFSAKNSKKSSKITTANDSWPEFPNTSDKIHVVDVDKDDFIDTMELMQNFTSVDNSRPVYCGFNINAGESRMTAVSGYHVLDRVVDWKFDSADKINIPFVVLKELKKVSAKWDCTLQLNLVENKRYLQIVSDDFEYIVYLTPGDFLDAKKAIPEYLSYKFTLDVKQLAEITKEYDSYNTKDDIQPMGFAISNGSLLSMYARNDYETCDVIEGSFLNMPDDYLVVMNPRYIRDAADVFKQFCGKNNNVTIECNGEESSPWVFKAENGYRAMILPVKAKPYVKEHFNSIVSGMLAA